MLPRQYALAPTYTPLGNMNSRPSDDGIADGSSVNSTQTTQVPVTVANYPLTYEYGRRDLWLAYGLTLSALLVAALVGIQAAMANKAGHSNRFSSCVRVAKITGLDQAIARDDDGSDPLPEELAKVRLQVTSWSRLPGNVEATPEVGGQY